MKNKYKQILVFIGLFIFYFLINYFSLCNNDLIWNYGFCYNFAKGLKMYTDFNMVITPLFPFIFGLIMRIFGNNMIVFFLSNALIPTLITYIVYKYYRKAFIEIVLLIGFISEPNYNLLCVLFLFILFVLEDKKKNDYIIGLVLGLTFLTKSSVGIICLASLYYIKDYKKILKRIIGFLIPNILFIIYFYIKGSLYDYINYAFLSLFDFASSNSRMGFGIIIFIISVIYIIYKFRKNKDIKLLYILLFQIMSYPIFNLMHIVTSLIPLLFYIAYDTKNKTYNKYHKYLLIFLICPILALVVQNVFLKMTDGDNALKYKRIESKYYDDAQVIKEEIDDLDNLYMIMYEAYYNKLLLGIKINKYDLLLTGNLGYNGEEEVIKYFDSLKSGTKFLMYNRFEGGQSSKKIYDHIEKNYKLIREFHKYKLYEK